MFFEKTPMGKAMRRKPITQAVARVLKPLNLFTDAELQAVAAGEVFVFDVESYPNYFCIAFKHVASGKVVYFEDSPEARIDIPKLLWMLYRFCLVGFNTMAYDMLIIAVALAGGRAEDMFEATDQVINCGARHSDIEKQFNCCVPFKINHIDLIEVAPLSAPLKAYAGRMHCERMQDLPYSVGKVLTKDEAWNTLHYCVNDLDNTQLLYLELLPQIKLRESLGIEYRQDLRSRSDAQIAEAVICSELAKLSGRYPQRPKFVEGRSVQYTPPAWVAFRDPALVAAVGAIAGATFQLDGNGSPVWPEGLGERTKGKDAWTLKVKLGGSEYKLGMGGLHSQETCISHYATEDTLLIDRDVASFYPRIILNETLYPKHLGLAFLEVYNGIVEKRLAAKKAKNTVTADALKITINGGFGKFGNKYSNLYSPDLLLAVTLTGQLALLMLIEMIEEAGIPVVSGNTDGIVIKCPVARYEDLNAVVARWEAATRFETEETQYMSTHSRDVNNYLALKKKYVKETNKWLFEADEWKVKGIYSERGSALNSVLSKNPETLICSDAVQAFIRDNVPIEKTITECKNLTRFISVRRVKDGAQKDGEYLGKIIRWYYAANEHGEINIVKSGNMVPKSTGAKPCMDLPPVFPADIDYDWYINEATEMLYDIGHFVKPKLQTELF